MSTEALVQMMLVAQASMDLWRAEDAASNARDNYHREINRYEAENGALSRLIRLTAPEHAAVREFTAAKYKVHQVAKRKVYAAKCRLKKACAKLARISAERPA